jgi:hypothetical protein
MPAFSHQRRRCGLPANWQAGGVALLGYGGSDCEALRDGWLGQPINAVSSLAYVAAGMYVAVTGRVALGVALAVVGAGSAIYHGPMPSGSGIAHDGSIVVFGAVALYVAWRRRLPRPPVTAVAVAVVGFAIYQLSRTDRPLCRPDSLLQGHAAWHVLTAISCALWLGQRPRARSR